jgi:hypothetical protein
MEACDGSIPRLIPSARKPLYGSRNRATASSPEELHQTPRVEAGGLGSAFDEHARTERASS